jgi:hypothetical protein
MCIDHVLVGGTDTLFKVRGGLRRVLRRQGKAEHAPGAHRRPPAPPSAPRTVDDVHAEREGAILMARSAR